MHIVIEGDAAPRGWPQPDCRCASCAALRGAGVVRPAVRVVLDGVPLEECSRWNVPGGYDVRAPNGGRLLYADGPGERPEPVTDVVYDAVLLDLLAHPDQLAALRRTGAVSDDTAVHAVHVDHRVRSAEELERRLTYWRRPAEGPHRTLLMGGGRSGKSAEAELRLIAQPLVTYVATGPMPDEHDSEWSARVRKHQERRPPWWRTVETADLAEMLRDAQGALLVDGIGTWLAAVMDSSGAWEEPDAARPHLEELVAAWRATEAVVVAVSDEVGLSLVPEHRSGRLFRDLLGEVNQLLAAESEEAALVVAGRVVPL